MKKHPFSLLILLIIGSIGCDHPFFTLIWKKYQHPTYGFTVRFPRSWNIKQDDLMGVAVQATSQKESESFKTNVNIVAAHLKNEIPLDDLAENSKKHLETIFNQYTFLGAGLTKMGGAQAIELRGRYFSSDGPHIMRSLIAINGKMQYILTFTVSEELEKDYLEIFDAIRNSFATVPP